MTTPSNGIPGDTQSELDLAEIVAAWPELSIEVRQRIVAMVRAAKAVE